jgi:hypothetical protein
VRDAVFAAKHKRHVVWTASKTLARMGIEYYPHSPKTNYRRMKALLRFLCDDGLLVARPALQSHYTLKEVAYERAATGAP